MFKIILMFALLAPAARAQAEMQELEIGVTPISETFEPPAANYPADQYGKVAVVQWAYRGFIQPGPPATKESAENFKQSARASSGISATSTT